MPGALGAAGRVWVGHLFYAGQGPPGDQVWQGSREVESGEGVEAFYAPDGRSFGVFAFGAADTGDPGAVESEVFGVDFVYDFRAEVFLGLADAAAGFDARDRRLKGGAGDPESRRHLAATLVLNNARPAVGAPGGYTEGNGLAPELARHDLAVVQGFSSESSGTM